MKPANRIAATFLLVSLVTIAPRAQTAATPQPSAPPTLVGSIATRSDWPQAKPEDVKSPEAILNAVYSVISGPKGQQRDWGVHLLLGHSGSLGHKSCNYFVHVKNNCAGFRQAFRECRLARTVWPRNE